MFEMAFKGPLEGDDDGTKRKQALNNIVVLVRDEAGAERVFKSGGVGRVLQVGGKERDIKDKNDSNKNENSSDREANI